MIFPYTGSRSGQAGVQLNIQVQTRVQEAHLLPRAASWRLNWYNKNRNNENDRTVSVCLPW